jgi:hypothetical protein
MPLGSLLDIAQLGESISSKTAIRWPSASRNSWWRILNGTTSDAGGIKGKAIASLEPLQQEMPRSKGRGKEITHSCNE